MNKVGATLAEAAPEDLIEAIAKNRDRAAFEALFDHFAPRIKALLVRNGTTPELAEELAQESMITVWRKADYFAAHRGSASAWIFTIARNLRIDEARRAKRIEVYQSLDDRDQEEPARPDELVSAAEHAVRVRAAMSNLPQEQLEVVRLSFVDGLAHSDIADRLRLPLGTVKSRLRLAMKKMRKSLEDLE